jgi:hypothetical protein
VTSVVSLRAVVEAAPVVERLVTFDPEARGSGN